MNFALMLPLGLSASFQKLASYLHLRNATHVRPALVPHAALPAQPPASAVCEHPAEPDPMGATHRPLRVVRVLEAGQPRSHVGRMLISGCMADVCAELDRLAAKEAALS